VKIEHAWVDDPVTRGEILPAKLCLQVDVFPDESIPYVSEGKVWEVGKHGPFIVYKRFGSPATAGDFNAALSKKYKAVVDISVFEDDDTDNYRDMYALPLTRARQKLKQFAPEWRMLLMDREAQAGKILWIPVRKDPRCKYWFGGEQVCGKEIVGFARRSGVDIPYCREHLEAFNREHARNRAQAS
jgi:hypothetical protein